MFRVCQFVLLVGFWLLNNQFQPLSWGQQSTAPVAADSYRVGVGREMITPARPMPMAGYASRTEPFQEVLADIWAKALVIEDAQQHVLLITLDLVGIDRQLSDEICGRLMRNHGLSREQICIATSHSHSGPVVGKNLHPMHYDLFDADQQAAVAEYTEFLVRQVEQSVEAAFDTLQPAHLQFGAGECDFAANRRNNAETQARELRTQGALVGPVDHSVPALVAYAQNGGPIAIVFGYACHSTVLSINKISGDYPGFAQAELERRFPGAQAMFWAGCGADINPMPRRDEVLAEFYGRHLAVGVESAMRTRAMPKISGAIVAQMSWIDLKFASLPTRDQLQSTLDSTNRYEVARARALLGQLEAQRELSPTYSFPIQSWKIGDGPAWIFLGGETVVDYSLRIKQEHADRPVWVASYANDVMAYIPSERVLAEGGYEGAAAMLYYGLPSAWAPGVESAIMGEVNDQLAR